MEFGNKDRHLYLLWTSSEPLTAEHMVMMYSTNAMLNRWWDNVTVIIWGGAQKLALENEAIKLKMEIARHAGVEFSACVSCANNMGITEDLNSIGIETVRWGENLSLLMQEGYHILTV